MELIDGVFYDMAAPTIVHQRIVAALWKQLDAFISRKGGSCVAAFAPIDVRLDRDDDTIVQPDVLIVCDPEQIQKDRIEGAPDFIAEIISPSTGAMDYIRKMAKYEAAGVKEYWIIDPEQRRMLIYDFAKDGIPQIRGLQGKAAVGLYDGELLIDLDLFAEIIERGY
jgi:Uma2 family endonuclease